MTPLPLRNQVNLEDALFHKVPENEECLPLSMFYSHSQTFVYKCTYATMGETANNLLQKEILLNGHRNDSDTLAHNIMTFWTTL